MKNCTFRQLSPSLCLSGTVCRGIDKPSSAPVKRREQVRCWVEMSLITAVVISWLLSISTFLKTWRRSESEMRSFSLMVLTAQPAPLRSPMMYCRILTQLSSLSAWLQLSANLPETPPAPHAPPPSSPPAASGASC